MSKTCKRGGGKAEMNLTPMIDVTFQLIIFFMLTNQIASEESVTMIVPRLEDPKVQELETESRVVVNVVPPDYNEKERKGDMATILGATDGSAKNVRVGLDDFTFDDLGGLTNALKIRADQAKAKGQEIDVILRADCGTFYDQVIPIMDAITAAGIATVKITAYIEGESK